MANEKRGKKVEHGIWENIDKNGNFDGTYSVSISRRFKIDNASRSSKQLFMRRRRIASLPLARREKRKLEDLMASKANKLQSGDKTWKEALDQYKSHLFERLADESIAPSTVENVRQTLEKHTSQWNSKMISWFNIEIFESYLNNSKLKNEITYATRKQILKFIRQVFKRQIALGHINHNPTNGVHIRRGANELKAPEKEPKVMQKEDFYKVLDFAKKYFPDWAIVYEVAFNSGLRSGELFSLVWSNVNFEMKQVNVKTSYDWKTEKILNTTKGKKDRIVPFSPRLEELLKDLKTKSTSNFVLPRIDDWRNGKAAEVLRRMQKEVKINYTTKFHALRGSYCTALLLAGKPPILVQKIMGHSSFRTTQFYIDLVGLDLKDVVGDALERNVIPINRKAQNEK